MNNKETNERALNDCHISSKVINMNNDRQFKDKNKNKCFDFTESSSVYSVYIKY